MNPFYEVIGVPHRYDHPFAFTTEVLARCTTYEAAVAAHRLLGTGEIVTCHLDPHEYVYRTFGGRLPESKKPQVIVAPPIGDERFAPRYVVGEEISFFRNAKGGEQ